MPFAFVSGVALLVAAWILLSPWVARKRRESVANRPFPAAWRVDRLNDQHAYLRVPPGAPLRPGDLVGCGVSHPCTTLDKWQLLFRVDDEDRVVEAVRTFF